MPQIILASNYNNNSESIPRWRWFWRYEWQRWHESWLPCWAGRRTSASTKRWSPTAPPPPPALVGAHHCLCAANPPIACRQSQLQLSSRLPGSQFSHFGQNLNLDQNATGFTLQALLDKDLTWWGDKMTSLLSLCPTMYHLMLKCIFGTSRRLNNIQICTFNI